MIPILSGLSFRGDHFPKGSSIFAGLEPLIVASESHTSVMIFLNYERIVCGACLSGNEIELVIVFLFGRNFNAPVLDDDRFI